MIDVRAEILKCFHETGEVAKDYSTNRDMILMQLLRNQCTILLGLSHLMWEKEGLEFKETVQEKIERIMRHMPNPFPFKEGKA